MRGGVDLLQLLDGDVRVDLGGGQVGVAQQRLDVADVRPVLQHVRGAGMPKQVRGTRLVDAGEGHVALHFVGQVFGRDRLAVVGNKQRIGSGLSRYRCHVPDVLSRRSRIRRIGDSRSGFRCAFQRLAAARSFCQTWRVVGSATRPPWLDHQAPIHQDYALQNKCRFLFSTYSPNNKKIEKADHQTIFCPFVFGDVPPTPDINFSPRYAGLTSGYSISPV